MKRGLILAGCVAALELGTAMVAARAGGAFDINDLTPIYNKILDAQRKAVDVTNDAEWALISPKLLKVVQLRMEDHVVARRAVFDGILGPGGGSGPPQAYQARMVSEGLLPVVPSDAAEEGLRKALEAQAPTAELDAAVAKVRAARQQRKADLIKAQSDLRNVLTPRQAAVLVLRGILD